MVSILLEGGISGGSFAGVGVLTFVIACIGLVIGPICLLIALIIYATKKDPMERNPAYKVFIKVGLGGLVAAGVCLLLTALFCSWH